MDLRPTMQVTSDRNYTNQMCIYGTGVLSGMTKPGHVWVREPWVGLLALYLSSVSLWV